MTQATHNLERSYITDPSPTTNDPARYEPFGQGAVRPVAMGDGRCQKCVTNTGGPTYNLYHDYDPHHRHNGLTCGLCGFEQVLTDGSKSLIKTTR